MHVSACVAFGYVLFVARANLFAEELDMDLRDAQIIADVEMNCVKQPFVTEVHIYVGLGLSRISGLDA
jgi:hypothetical protein